MFSYLSSLQRDSLSFYLFLSLSLLLPFGCSEERSVWHTKDWKGFVSRERVGRGCEQCSGREKWLEYLEIVTRKKEKQSAEKGGGEGGEGGGAGLVVLNGY